MAQYYGNQKPEAHLHHKSQDSGKHALFFWNLTSTLNPKQPHPHTQKGKQNLGLENNDQNFIFFRLENKTNHVLPAVTHTQIVAGDNPSH